MKIDIPDAVDRLQCMAREITIPDTLKRMNPILAESRQKDIDLLQSLAIVVRSFGNLEDINK